MHIAYTVAPGRGDTDLLLYQFAQLLERKGLRACGTVQINSERVKDGPCDMDIQILPGRETLRISQELGEGARGCRLDPVALETAVARVQHSLTAGADLLIVNKFGKHEAEGRGFREVIGQALAQGVPVLVGLNGLNVAAFNAFSGGLAKELPPDAKALEAWVNQTLGQTDMVA